MNHVLTTCQESFLKSYLLRNNLQCWEIILHRSLFCVCCKERHRMPFCSILSLPGCLFQYTALKNKDSVFFQSKGQVCLIIKDWFFNCQ